MKVWGYPRLLCSQTDLVVYIVQFKLLSLDFKYVKYIFSSHIYTEKNICHVLYFAHKSGRCWFKLIFHPSCQFMCHYCNMLNLSLKTRLRRRLCWNWQWTWPKMSFGELSWLNIVSIQHTSVLLLSCNWSPWCSRSYTLWQPSLLSGTMKFLTKCVGMALSIVTKS